MEIEIFNSSVHRVLVVDDGTDDWRSLADGLLSHGYCIVIATDGLDGVKKAEALQPDLILMSIRMPVCCGITACRLIKSDPRTAKIPLIFLTAPDHLDDRVQGLLEGAVDYISRPLDFNDVRTRVNIHLSGLHQSALPEMICPGQCGKPSNFDQLLFRAAHRLLHDSLAQTPELADLALALGVSKRRLNATFRFCTGLTVCNYWREIRMARARMMLHETGLTIEVIASELRFDSRADLSSTFRTRFGISPRNFRTLRELQGPEPGAK